MTKKKRLEIYKYMLENFNKNDYGFCARIENYRFNVDKSVPNAYWHMDQYEELYAMKPQNGKACWFPYTEEGFAKRKRILIQIIKDMENTSFIGKVTNFLKRIIPNYSPR